jgi:hypothetical protein
MCSCAPVLPRLPQVWDAFNLVDGTMCTCNSRGGHGAACAKSQDHVECKLCSFVGKHVNTSNMW